MQSTGLIDKNGAEIYEGDIVEYFHLVEQKTLKGEVVYDSSSACWGIKMRNNSTVFPDPAWYAWFCDDVERDENGELYVRVIGNIYENPELLEGE